MQGFFNVSQNNNNEPFDILCELDSILAINEVPTEQAKLYLEVESTNNVIKSLIKTEHEIKNKYFQKLLSLARAGLVSDIAQPKLALMSLEKLKEEIILIEGQRIKNYYMKKLGLTAFIFFVVFLVFYFVLYLLDYKNITSYLVTFISAVIGSWISFGARKFRISFEQLCVIEEDMMIPIIRLLYIGICSIIFLLFLNCGVIKIFIGNISTSDINNSMELQAIIGILCGLVESKIGISLYNKAVTIIGKSLT